MVILDTSIWIEFFRTHEPIFGKVNGLIDSGSVLGLPWVFGELFQGARDQREITFLKRFWRAIPKPELALSEKAWIQAGVESHRGNWMKKGVGLIDAAIVVSAIELQAPVASLDRKLIEVLRFKKALFSL